MPSVQHGLESAQTQKGMLLMGQEYDNRQAQLEERVEQLEIVVQMLCTHLGINPAQLMERGMSGPPEIEAIRQALLSGNKINAIKIYRSIYGVGLKEAKEAVEAMERNMYR